MAALEIVSLDTTTPQLRAPSAADTYTAPRAMDISPVALTGSAATSSLSIAQTWNTTGTPTAIDLNVTDTASNASSRLLDLRVGGSSKFAVDKAGDLRWQNNFRLYRATSAMLFAGSARITTVAGASFSWTSSTTDAGSVEDLQLFRDAANTLAQRNGVNAQAFNIYNTFTDASNYSRFCLKSSVGNVAFLTTEGAGTSSAAQMAVIAGGSALYLGYSNTSYLRIEANALLAQTDNAFDIGAATANRPRNVFQAGYHQMSEMTAPAAPATNGVRIFAQDNGAGKTQLMALFATGAAQQIAIEP